MTACLTASGASNGLSFWLSLRGARGASSVYAVWARTSGLMRASAASAGETAPDMSGMRTPPLPAAAQDGFEPGRQGAGAERLRQEVVGAELEHAHFVVLVSLGGEHDDGDRRRRRTRPQVREHAVAVEPRKIQVEDDDIRPHPIDLVERLHPVARLRHG